MLRYIVIRLLAAVPTIAAILFITFTLTYLSPFDPVRLALVQEEALGDTLAGDDELIAKIRARYGLDDPFMVQFGRFVRKLSQGDLGISINGQKDVVRSISKTFPISLQMGFAGAFMAALFGIPLGAIAAMKQNSALDYVIVGGTLSLRTTPVFVLAPILLFIFVLILGVMTVPRGWNGLFSSKTILPVFILMLAPLPVVIRQTRQAVLEIFSQDYIRTAKAKGLRMQIIILRHILRNALIPVVTSLGFVMEGLIIGAIFLDSIFAIPGFGAVSEAAFRTFDYPVIMGIVLVSAIVIVLTNLLVDLIYPFLDPRITLS